MGSDRDNRDGLFLGTRRSWLKSTACGFGQLAAGALACQSRALGHIPKELTPVPPGLHHLPRAKRVIFLFMQGGVSQVDTFDPKPLLDKKQGMSLNFDDARDIANTGSRQTSQRVLASPWKFRRYGETGTLVSDLFPEVGGMVDELCLLRAMHTDGVAHGPATLFLHCGSTNAIRPSMGSWIYYGLGSENQDIPGFISISPPIGNGGVRNYGNAFLPSTCQGTGIGQAGLSDTDLAIKNLSNDVSSLVARQKRFELIQDLNRLAIEQNPSSEWEAVLQSYEFGWRMQERAPEVFELDNETEATHRLYGIDRPESRDYGRKCLLARRLCESGVRFVQVNYGDNTANPAWDQHSNLPKHADHARAVDRPIAGLLRDLKQRGLLEDTLVWWGGEFGRTPYAQDNGTGRDHNPGGFTMWLAGGGSKPGRAIGATDAFGHQAIEDKIHMHDLHATILHLLGIDHLQLTYRYAGRDFRLTDVHGRVITKIFS